VHKENKSEIIRVQALQVTNKYEGLEFLQNDNGICLLKGVLAFEGEYESLVLADAFDIEMQIPPDYPDNLPVVKEIGYRIPREFHTYSGDNTLCLAAPLAVKIQFSLNKTLLGFIENLIIPFFFNYLHLQQYETLPFGELSHGAKGILEFYKSHLHIPESGIVLRMIKLLATQDYRGYSKCPCNSGKNLRNCHGRQLLKCMTLQTPQEFAAEYWVMRNYVLKRENNA